MATVRHVTLTANTVATVNLPVNPSQVEITMRGTTPAETYVTTNGVNPTVAGNDCALVPGVAGATVVLDDESASPPVVVKLISTGTPSLAVRAVGL
jgi:hypothetical protein